MESKLSVEIGAQLTNLNSQFAKAVSTVTDGTQAMNDQIGKTERSFKLLNNTKFTFGANYASASKQLATESAKTSVILGGAMVKSSNQAAFALQNLGRVAQDAPFGFIGIQNNLNPLLESFGRLKAETGSTGAALKALGSSLIGPAGLGIALSVVSAGILFYQQYQQRAKKSVDETTKSVAEQRAEFIKTPYEKAFTDLTELTRNVQLAKQGFLDKKEVLKQYNEGIGQTIGKVTDLDAAEQMLVKNGDAYLRLMFLKANAEFAFKKAAEESYNLSLKQSEIDAKAPKISDKFKINADRSKKDVEEGLTKPLKAYLETTNQVSRGLDGVNTKVEIISKNLGEQLLDESQLKTLEKQSGKAVDIAKSAQQQVIDFAKKNGFNLNGLFDIKPDGKNPLKNLREDLIKGRVGLEDVSGRINTDLDDFLLDYKKTAEELGKVPLIPVESFKIQGKDFETAFEVFNKQLDSLADNLIDGSLAGLGSAIGEAMATGTNAFEAGGKALLGSFGGFLTEYGKLLIKYGAAAVLKGKLDLAALIPGAGIPAGIAAIAAGVALVAAGAAIGNFASGNNSSSEGVTRPRKIPGFANGVRDFTGGLAVVGERGPELVNLPTGSSVIPNHNLSSFGGGDIVFNVSSRIDQLGNLITAIDRERSRLRRVGA